MHQTFSPRPTTDLTRGETILLRLALTQGHHDDHGRSDDGENNGPGAKAPSPVISIDGLCCFRATKSGDDVGRRSECKG